MKRAMILFILILLIFPLISAIELEVKKISSDEVLIMGLEEPLTVTLQITNKGSNDNFMFYTFFGSDMYPKGTVRINTGETKEVEIGIYPRPDFQQRGYVTFDYFIKSSTRAEQKESLTIKIVELEDVFEIGSGEIYPEENSIKIYIKNRVNFRFDDVKAKFSSAFFDVEKSFPIDSGEKVEFDVQVNKEEFRQLMAGFYTMKADISVNDKKVAEEGTINFLARDLLTTTKQGYGFIITTDVVRKTNDGNTIAESETMIKKNIISRLFTTFSPEPDIVERKGLGVDYTWARSIKPGETFEVAARTNWIFPVLLIFFIGATIFLTRLYSRTNLILKKKVSFVKAKGGEFALKVSIIVHSKKHLENISITDRVPPLVKIHQRFGAEKPRKIDEKNRKLEWAFDTLEAGEIRIISYIVYSRIGVLGRFALPPASAIYRREGQMQETSSNRAFFITEQRIPDED
jgi:hypothetical protein